MTTDEMKLRTKKFSLMIIDLAERMPNTNVIRSITNQIVRSGTSVEQIIAQCAELEVIENLWLK
jgi:four helix bundle protein